MHPRLSVGERIARSPKSGVREWSGSYRSVQLKSACRSAQQGRTCFAMLCVAGARRRWGCLLLLLDVKGGVQVFLQAGVRGAECGIVEARARKPMS